MDCSQQPITDQALVSACLQGDRRAFGELICRYRDGVVNVVYRMCGDSALAEEAAQEAFIRAWQRMDRYDPQYAFRPWLYRIAINLALDVIRRDRQTVEIDSPLIENRLVSEVDEPEQAFLKKERVNRVRRAVLDLPDASRAVIVLREYEGLTYQEIAAALNIPVGTVMSRLNYARNQLRERLAEAPTRINAVVQEV